MGGEVRPRDEHPEDEALVARIDEVLRRWGVMPAPEPDELPPLPAA